VNQSAPASGGPAPLTITNTSFPDGVLGQSYSQGLATSGGCPGSPAAFSVTDGALPDGLSISGQSISGTPQTAGPFNFTLQATDSCSNTASGSFSITIDTTVQPSGGDTVFPASLSFSVQQNSATPPQDQSVLVNGTAGTYTAAVSSGAPWLVIRQSSNLTIPGLLTLGVTNYANMTPGMYSTTVTVTPQDGSAPLTVLVALTVQAAPFSATPSSLTFASSGGGSGSAVRTLSVTSTSLVMQYTVAVSMTDGANWLFATPGNGTTPGTVSVTVSPGSLAPGTYNGQIVLTPAFGGALSVPISLTVTAPITLAANPATLALTPQADGTVAATPVAISMSDGSAVSFSASAATQSGGNWLSIDTPAGSTPATLTVSADPQGLAPGAYNGTIAITPSDATIAPLTVPVTLTISAASGPVIGAVTNAASFLTGPVSPGELVVIFGTGLGPSSLAGMSLDAAGLINNQLSGTQVFFDDIAAPMVYSSALQIAAIVPYELGRASTRVRVAYQGTTSAPVSLQVAASNPGIFTMNSQGQGAVLNQDYSLNSPQNGTEPGKVIFVYATGGGFTDPPSIDGTIAAAAASTVLPASVQIDGLDAKVLYAGAAPGLPAGALQVNAEVPKGVHRGTSVPLVLTIGNASSQTGVTVAVKP